MSYQNGKSKSDEASIRTSSTPLGLPPKPDVNPSAPPKSLTSKKDTTNAVPATKMPSRRKACTTTRRTYACGHTTTTTEHDVACPDEILRRAGLAGQAQKRCADGGKWHAVVEHQHHGPCRTHGAQGAPSDCLLACLRKHGWTCCICSMWNVVLPGPGSAAAECSGLVPATIAAHQSQDCKHEPCEACVWDDFVAPQRAV